MAYTYEYPRPALAVDVVALRRQDADMEVLLIRRKGEPFRGQWALPGGFLGMDETAEEAAARELAEETGVRDANLQSVGVFSAVNRDPRERVVSIAFLAVLGGEVATQAGDDADRAEWFSLTEMPPLAFDHEQIFEAALDLFRCSFD